MAQRDLQHRGTEFDALGCGGERAENDERVQRRPPAAERVRHPDPREAALLDPARVIDDALERPVARLAAGAQKIYDAQPHSRSTIARLTNTSPSCPRYRPTIHHMPT